MEPEDREMSLYEFVTHSSMGSYLSLVMLRLQPNSGFNLMSFCYCLPDTVPIEKELMVPALKGGSQYNEGDKAVSINRYNTTW